jgi:hypothetical protein
MAQIQTQPAEAGGANAYTAGSNGSTGTGTNTGSGAIGFSLVAKNTEWS